MTNSYANKKKKIWLTIVISLFLVGCLTTLSIVLLLKKGVNLDTFSVGRVLVSGFSLVWQEKLEIHIDTVTLTQQHDETPVSKDFKNVRQSVKALLFGARLFSSLTVREISLGELTGSLNLNQGTDQEPGIFTLASKDLAFRSNLSLDQDTIVIDITEAVSKRFNSQAAGQIRLDTDKEQFTGTLAANLGGSLPVTLDFTADSKQISFQGQEAGRIETITPLVDLFGLKPNIQRWITKYLKGSRYHLKTFKGVLPWNAPRAILDTLYAEVRVEDCEYTFAPGLEPIETSNTDVVFSKGVLTITPHNSTFYGQSGGASWLDIDFNDPANILLTAHIKTNARADDDILTLLGYYNINIPFKQVEGKTATDLVLKINLNRMQVTASGSFLIDEGVVEWDGKNYRVANAKIVLDNSAITIEHMVAGYEEQFVAGITGTFNAGNGVGDMEISLTKLTAKVGPSILTINNSGPKPTIGYHIRPDGHSVDVSTSSWKLDGLQLDVAPFSSPFSVKNFSGVLPPTLLTIPPGISAEVSGAFSIREQQADLICNVLQYKVKDLVLESSSLPLTIHYDQGLILQTEETSQWSLNNISTTIYPSELRYGDNILSIINNRISYGSFFDSRISGQYNNLQKHGTFLLTDLQIIDKNIDHLLKPGIGIPVEINGEEDQLVIKVPELDLAISSGKNNNWSATFRDLSTLHQRSTLLQQYYVDTGSLSISSKDGKKPYSFSADIPYRYPMLVKDSKPVDLLHIAGEITDQGIFATVNKELHIDYTDRLSVTSENIGYNIPAILNFFKDRPKSMANDFKEKKKVTATFEATNSSLFFRPDNQAPADRIHLEYDGDRTIVNLEYGPGSIVLEIEGDQFTLEGKELNDAFMGALIQGADFNSGKMTMAAKGSFDQSSVLIKVDNTTLKSLRPMNNMLAFLNTVPALITFSYPEYNTRGLPIISAVVGMVINQELATIEAFDITSPVFTMTGAGWINIPQNLMDMDFNLITQAKANINKIPLLGYIMVGKEKRPSITLKVHGNLQDPKVENSMYREVATMPFSILYRTLALPFHMVESMADKADDTQDLKNSGGSGETTEKKQKP